MSLDFHLGVEVKIDLEIRTFVSHCFKGLLAEDLESSGFLTTEIFLIEVMKFSAVRLITPEDPSPGK